MTQFDQENPAEIVKSFFTVRKRQRDCNVKNTNKPSDKQLAAYSMDVVRAIRSNDIETLQQLHEDGHSFDACNLNHESLLHLACRRGSLETIKFLVTVAGVSTDVTDNMGRTVLHDVCWRPNVDLDVMKFLLQASSPDLLVADDVRGHTCFDYCRKENWTKWVDFLNEESSYIMKRIKLMDMFE